MKSRSSVVAALGVAQTLAWASSFYLPAMLAAPIASELGLASSSVFALLSMSLVLSAVLSPWAGKLIDQRGGRPVLLVSSGLFALALASLAVAPGWVGLTLAWLIMGVAMACGLYDAAFASLVRIYGADARRAITGITLIAGFASSVGWPMTAAMEAAWGWRGACAGWAALHLLLGLPLNLWLPRVGAQSSPAASAPLSAPATVEAKVAARSDPPLDTAATVQPLVSPRRRALFLLTLIFTFMACVSTAIATHLPALLQASGASLASAVAMASLAGPSQVAARLFELGVLSRFSPLLTARLATLGHPLGAACVLAAGSAAALPFVVLHGLGNGLLTIVRGTLPLAVFGAQGYGVRQGWIAMPGRLLGALSPWAMGLVLERWGASTLWLTATLALASLAALLLLRLPTPAASPKA
jgi:MFS family permease